ncbi:TlpA family protein disulfide reductase [Actinomadura rupiterrae]|uniref:TlpA family protein disulfide reductase n=1 Tax=Actinomadura rupiterrae TaxID=559627 RepID=UPI0020A47CC4|nr:redoxin family protein [Actinomadura rupiterrae]MCP2342829.1 peroxiredoxin [Actinomadura rupiterrae]
MIFAAVGLVLVGAVGLVNLALLLVMLRRWRELEAAGSAPAAGTGAGLRVIDRIPAFSTAALDGTAVTERALLGKETLVGFFSLTCKACVTSVPVFAEHAERLRALGGVSLAIVHGDGAAESDLAAQLRDAFDLVIAEDVTAALSKQFGAKHYPTYAWYDTGGVVTSAGVGVAALRTEMAAT